jgi:nitroreductase
MTAFDLAETDRLLTTTRAVRKRLDLKRPVPEAVLRECLEIALQAPTGSNAQNWSWIIVTDAAKRARLAELYRQTAEPYLKHMIPATAAKVSESDPAYGKQIGRVADSAVYLMDVLAEVPVHVIPCLQIPPGTPQSNMAGASIYPAVWSFQLALRSRGLGSTLTTLHLLKEKEAAELLGLPEDIRQFALLPVAYTTVDDFKAAKRQPLDSVLHWNQW